MLKKKIPPAFTVLTILLYFFMAKAFAVPVPNLYQVSVPVASQSTENQQKALKQATKDVLIKVSGNSNVMTIPRMQQLLTINPNLVEQYHYDRMPAEDKTKNTAQSLKLVVQFDPKAVQQLLQQAGQVVWPDDRPSILIWLVIKTPAGLNVVASDSTNPAYDLVKKSAEHRGLPILFPLFDLTDLQKVSPNALWQLDLPQIRQASLRYDAEKIAVGRLTEISHDRWQAQWSLIEQDHHTSWQEKSNKESDVIAAGMTDIANHLGAEYEVLGKLVHNNTVTLKVDNINTVTQYSHVLQYLQKLPTVTRVQIVSIQDTAVTFNLSLNTDRKAFERELANSTLLLPTKDSETTEKKDDSDLQYRLTS